MRARIQQNKNGFYYGEVYRPPMVEDKDILNNMNCQLNVGWNTVTQGCYTKLGCKLEIKRWKKKHWIDYYDI